MANQKKYSLYILLIACLCSTIQAQTQTEDARLDSLETIAKERPHIEISGTYSSLVAFNGRTEGVNQTGLSPSIAAHLGKGFALNYEGDVWSANTPRYAFTSIGIAKEFEMGKNGEGEIAYSRWFFNTTAANQKSDFSNAIDLDTHWDVGDLTIGNTASVLFGPKQALFFQPNIKYEIGSRFGGKRLSKWAITPSVFADIGNDVVTRVVRKNILRPLKPNGKTVFGVLDIDASVLAMLSHKGTDFSVAYHYILPQKTVAPNPTAAFSVWEIALTQSLGW
jgi:hypothetical protein